MSAVSASSASLASSFTEGFGQALKVVAKASSEPRLPTCLLHLGVPSRRADRADGRGSGGSVPKTGRGRGPASPMVAEWEHAVGQRAALYPICAMTPQEARDWGAPTESNRWHHDSSLVSAVVFGNPVRPDRRRTRPGSVDPGLETNLPGCVTSAGLPTSRSCEGRRSTPRSPASPATCFEVDGVSIRSATETDRYTPRVRRRVPGLSDSGTAVGELLFHSKCGPHGDSEELGEGREEGRQEGCFWEGCAGQATSRDKQSSKQIATLWDLQGSAGYAGLSTASRSVRSMRSHSRGTGGTGASSDPESPSSQASQGVSEPPRWAAPLEVE